MWKLLAALLVGAAVIGSSVWLFHNRHWLFAPDIERQGGTRLVLRVQGDREAVAEALRKRFDPRQLGAVAVRVAGERVYLDVPEGESHGDTLDHVRRLLPRSGRLWLALLAEEKEDAEAVAAARAWLADPANAKALKRCEATLTPPFAPVVEGGGRYAWVVSSTTRRGGGAMPVPAAPGAVAVAPVAVSPAAVSHAFSGPAGGRGEEFVLVREAPSREQISTADLVQVRSLHEESLMGSMPRGPQLLLRLSPEAATRRRALVKASPGRQMVLVLGHEVLQIQETSSSSEYEYFLPAFESPRAAEDARALLSSPLPDGVRVEVVEEITFPR